MFGLERGAIDAQIDSGSGADGEQTGKDIVSVTHVAIERVRVQDGARCPVPGCVHVLREAEGDELVGVRDRQLSEHHRVDERVDRGIRADADRQSSNHEDREAGVAAQRTQRVAEVAHDLDVHDPRHLG